MAEQPSKMRVKKPKNVGKGISRNGGTHAWKSSGTWSTRRALTMRLALAFVALVCGSFASAPDSFAANESFSSLLSAEVRKVEARARQAAANERFAKRQKDQGAGRTVHWRARTEVTGSNTGRRSNLKVDASVDNQDRVKEICARICATQCFQGCTLTGASLRSQVIILRSQIMVPGETRQKLLDFMRSHPNPRSQEAGKRDVLWQLPSGHRLCKCCFADAVDQWDPKQSNCKSTFREAAALYNNTDNYSASLSRPETITKSEHSQDHFRPAVVAYMKKWLFDNAERTPGVPDGYTLDFLSKEELYSEFYVKSCTDHEEAICPEKKFYKVLKQNFKLRFPNRSSHHQCARLLVVFNLTLG